MAGDINKELSLKLSYKLQDPVAAGNTNGERIDADQRLYYLESAANKLNRMARILYPTLADEITKNYLTYGEFNTNDAGVVQGISFERVITVMVRADAGDPWVSATELKPDEFVEVKTEQNEFYIPDREEEKFYYSVFNGAVSLLPADQYSKTFIHYQKSVATPTYSANDIEVPRSMYDILLNLAAGEAMMDLGQLDMVQIFNGEASNQLKILGQLKMEKEAKDEN